MSGSDCIRHTRPCTCGDCHRGAAYVMYEYRGAYRWTPDKVYACPDHVEQLALQHRVTASEIVPYDDKVPF